MRDRAADGAAVAGHEVTDVRDDLGEQRMRPEARIRLSDRCSDRHRAVGRHLAHLDDGIDVDEQ
jgi:hypothetical protein